MVERKIRLSLHDDVVRGMNRQQYKAASHWIRSVARLVEAGINWKAFDKHLADLMTFGFSNIHLEDLVKS